MTTTAQRLDLIQPGLSSLVRKSALRELFATGRSTVAEQYHETFDGHPAKGNVPFLRHLDKFVAQVTAEYDATRTLLAAAIAGHPENTLRRPTWSPRARAQFTARAASREIDHTTPEGIDQLADIAIALQELADLDPLEVLTFFTLPDSVLADVTTTIHARAIAQTAGDTTPEGTDV